MIKSTIKVALSFMNLQKWIESVTPSCELCGGGPGQLATFSTLALLHSNENGTHSYNNVLAELKRGFKTFLRGIISKLLQTSTPRMAVTASTPFLLTFW